MSNEDLPSHIPRNDLFSKLANKHIPHIRCLVIGGSSTGKTYLVTKILRNYGVDFDQLYIFAPTFNENPLYKYLSEALQNGLTNDEISPLYEDPNSYSNTPEEKVKYVLEHKKKNDNVCNRFCFTYPNKEDIPNLALERDYFNRFLKNICIFDDILGLDCKDYKKIKSFATHSRHSNASFFLLTQNLSDRNAIDSTIKKQVNVWVFFYPFNFFDMKYFYYTFLNSDIFEDFFTFKQFVGKHLSKPHEYLLFIPTSLGKKVYLSNEVNELLPL